MKITSLGFISILIFLIDLYSCHSSSNYNADEARRLDSTRRADSILRVQNALTAEGRQKGFDDVEKIISSLSYRVATYVCPASAQAIRYQIDSNNATYSLITKTYSVRFKSDFMGDVGMLDTNRQLHEFFGSITLYSGYDPRLKIDSLNETMKQDVKNIQDLNEIYNGLQIIDSLTRKQ
jgi:hypothetical protein